MSQIDQPCWNCGMDTKLIGQMVIEEEDGQEITYFFQCQTCRQVHQADTRGLGLSVITSSEMPDYLGSDYYTAIRPWVKPE